MQMTMDQASAWADRYFTAWKTNDAGLVASLFSEDAIYFYGPFREPAHGRDAIVRRWTANDQQRNVVTRHEVIAVTGDTAVIHWAVTFDHAAGSTALDGVLIVRFHEEGACREHREWYAERSAAPG